jgi:cytochrome c-type biogenesis protein CcmF
MVVHPPLLYIGLVGLIVPFAIASSALITGRTEEWLGLARRWMLVPWLALGAGLVVGGAWAYTELGWGGYWGWDPVENAALMPWLVATAFLHSAMVEERLGILKIWNVLLVTLSGVMATFGTFLTRSGLLSSVHTFAESPIGRWFFGFLALQTLAGLGLLVWRLPQLRSRNSLGSPLSKEAAFLANNVVFVCAAAVVLWGTVLPLATEAVTGTQLAVGPPFFNRVMTPIGAILLLLASAGTVVGWRRSTASRIAGRLRLPAALATAASLALLAATRRPAFSGIAWIALLLAATSVAEIARARARLTDVFRRDPRRYGGYVVHLGIAIMIVGFAGSLGRTQTETVAAPGEAFRFAGYTLRYERLERFAAPDKDVNRATLALERGGRRIATLRPQLNFHHNWEQPQSEIAIRTTPLADLYVILAGTNGQEAIFRVHRNPLVVWVWAGAAVALAGGLTALLLTGAGRRPRAPGARALVNEPAGVPL